MSARATVYTLISEDSELATLGVGNTYAANAVDTPPEDLFVVIKWEPTRKAFGLKGIDRISVWAYDTNQDYGRIDSVLRRIKELLTGSVHVAGADGWTLTQADWLGEGPDLYDSGYNAVTRYAEFDTVSRYAPS